MEFGILHHQYPLHVPTTYGSTSMSVQLSYDSLLRNSDMPGGATALTAQVGIHQRWSADGHDKLYKILGFPIWAIVDDAISKMAGCMGRSE